MNEGSSKEFHRKGKLTKEVGVMRWASSFWVSLGRQAAVPAKMKTGIPKAGLPKTTQAILRAKKQPHTKNKPQIRRRTNVQQLTCKIDLPFSFYYLFFSFVLLELKPFVSKGKVLGEKL